MEPCSSCSVSHPATSPGTRAERSPVSFASSVNLDGSAAFGARPEKSRALTRPSRPMYASARPIPPTPDIMGSTTLRVAATATEASKAFPPSMST